MTNIHMINEFNNNTIFAGNGKKKAQLPDSIVDNRKDIGRIPGLYKNDDNIFTIYGNAGEFFISSHFCLKLTIFYFFYKTLPLCACFPIFILFWLDFFFDQNGSGLLVGQKFTEFASSRNRKVSILIPKTALEQLINLFPT